MKKNTLFFAFLLCFSFFGLAQAQEDSENTQEEATEALSEQEIQAQCDSYSQVTTNETRQANGSVNIRSVACLSGSNIVGVLSQGDVVQVVAAKGFWLKIEVDGEVLGWVSQEYLDKLEDGQEEASDSETIDDPSDPQENSSCEPLSPIPVADGFQMKVKSTSGLNLRTGPCTDKSTVLTTLPAEEVVEVLQSDGGWYQIKWGEETEGWVSAQYLTDDLDFIVAQAESQTNSNEWAFTDIWQTLYADEIQSLYEEGILKGNPDGTYKPYSLINRAEFTMILMRTMVGDETTIAEGFNTACFPDIPLKQWYTKSTCKAKNEGIIAGRPDGLFWPGDKINLAEASKIIVNTLELNKKTPQPDRAWYEIYIHALDEIDAIPPTLRHPDDLVTREQMAAMIYVALEKEPLPYSTSFDYFPIETPLEPDPEPETTPSETQTMNLEQCVADVTLDLNMDFDAMVEDVLALINTERAERGLEVLEINPLLNASAMIWAQEGQFTHTRPNDQSFDEYQQSIGLTDYNELGESVAQPFLTCGADGCMGSDVVDEAEQVKNLFLEQEGNPEGLSDDFDNLVNPNFTQFGFGFLVRDDDSVLMVYQFADDGVVGDEQKLCEGLE